MNLVDVKDRVSEDDAGKWDTLVDRDELRLQDGCLRIPRHVRPLNGSSVDGPRSLGLTSWATSQLCQKLGIPVSYFRRCPQALKDAQVNHWLYERGWEEKKPEKWLLRVKGSTLRGVLSDRYSRLDNRDVLECFLPLLSESPFEVKWFAVTDESLHLRLVDPRFSRDVLPGDRVMAGIHVGNSEVGLRAVTVDAMVWRLVCTNGLVRLVKGRSLLHQRHMALSKGDLRKTLDQAIREALVQGTGFMERMHQATREVVPDMEDLIATIAREGGLSQAVETDVKAAILRENGSQQETLYGLVNALTFVAQGLSPDDRYALEAIAGRVLEEGVPKKSGGSREVVPLSVASTRNGASDALTAPALTLFP